MSDAALGTLAARCRHLESLSLYECPRVSDAGLERAAAARLARLRWVSVPKCDGVTRAGLTSLLRSSPSLTRVSCSLSDGDARLVRAAFPGVRVEVVGD